MLYVSILILAALVIICIISVRYKDEKLINSLDKKEHKLYFLYPVAALLTEKTGLNKMFNKTNAAIKVKFLHVSDQGDKYTKLYLYKKLSLILSVVFLFSGLSLILSVQHILNNSGYFNGVLVRPETGKEDVRIRLKFRMQNETDDNDAYEGEIIVKNSARSYTETEWEQILKEAVPYLEKKMLGENESPDYVHSNLNFFKEIPETGISVEWIPENHRLISSNGKVLNTDLTEKKDTWVTAVLKYRDKRVEHTIPLTVWPSFSDDKDKLYQKLQKIIAETEKQKESEKEWTLPDKVDKYIVNWEKPVSNPAGSIFILGILASVSIWFLTDRDLDNRLRQKNNQMLQDYSEIINKFSLLVNAGMTIKQAWFNISEDYIKKRDDGKGKARHAYEEMLVTWHELKLGVPEAKAYEQFGQRVGLLPYMKFSSLLVQNLKKGNKDMVNLLKAEAMEAIHERKEAAKKLGEEASTKLLAPMAIMLLIVLIIIMIPAFVSFNI